MTEKLKLKDPWLVAVWPGMGHVALNAGYYLLSKLAMPVAGVLGFVPLMAGFYVFLLAATGIYPLLVEWTKR